MNRHVRWFAMLVASLTLVVAGACGDDAGSFPRPDAAPDGAAGTLPELDGSVDGAPAAPVKGLVAINSDYSSSAVSLLDRDGNLLADSCLTSGSGSAGMTMTLSGDVVLPTQVPAGGPVALIDRGKSNDAITWLDVQTCAVVGQLAVATGFHSNPQDVVTLSASKAYVVRQDANPAPTPAPGDFDEGNDVLVVDPTRLALAGRIDLLPFAPAGVLPRGHRALLAGGRVFVSLNAISLDYKSYADGRIVVIDPATDQVTGVIDIPGAQNCGAMTYVAATQRLFVSCGGAYGAPGVQVATSAVVAIDLGPTGPAVVARVAAASAANLPFSNTALAALDGNTVLAVAVGDFSGNPPDSLWLLPFDGQAPAKLFTASESFALGAVLFDGEHGRALLADGPTMGPAYLRTFDLAAGALTAGKTAKTSLTTLLAPRALALY